MFKKLDDSQISVLLWTFSFLVGLGVFFVKKRYPEISPADLGVSITSAFVFAIFGYIIRLWFKINDYIKVSQKYHSRTSSFIDEFGKRTKINEDIDKYEELMCAVATEFIEHYSNIITTSAGSFEVKADGLAVLMNKSLWSNLIKLKNKYPEINIEVMTTHSTSVHMWQRGDLLKSLIEQKKFVKIGGKITRIIEGVCTYEEVSSADPEGYTSASIYRRAIDRMKGTEVKYIYEPGSDSNSDFMIVRLGDSALLYDVAMIWKAIPNNMVIESCRIITQRYEGRELKDLEDRWEALEDDFERQKINRKN